MRIKAVAFDVDGTLYPYRMMLTTSLLLAVRFPRFLFHFRRVRAAIRQTPPSGDFRTEQARMLAGRLGTTEEKARELIELIVYRLWIDGLRSIRPYPHVVETVAELRQMGLKLAVMSDYPVERKLAYLGLKGLWDYAFCSEETGRLKPDPRPFGVLCERLDLEPGSVLYVGDHCDYDVRGAAAAGLHTAHLLRGGENRCAADLAFDSYAHFGSEIRRAFD
jgi:putative hydrolase of the HAD superfamily